MKTTLCFENVYVDMYMYMYMCKMDMCKLYVYRYHVHVQIIHYIHVDNELEFTCLSGLVALHFI